MKINIKNRILLLAIIILSGNGIMGYLVFESNQKVHDSGNLIFHTDQILLLSSDIITLGKEIEIASLSYIINGETTFLNTLYGADKKTNDYISQLKQLTKDNPVQQIRIDSLRFYMDKSLTFSLQQVELRRQHGLLKSIEFTSDGPSEVYILKLRQITTEIQQEELFLLKQRKLVNEQSLNSYTRLSIIMFVLTTILAILLLIVIGIFWSQDKDKEKRAADLVIANKELAFQNNEKQKRADELDIANKELAFQNKEKQNRADELLVANTELAFQNYEKQNRADELNVANKELAFQNDEKQNRADELFIANKELAFQNDEKQNRADELFIANKELAFQNDEKQNRADELSVANKELAFQNEEKQNRADELTIANKELAFQNDEKQKRADELNVANKELAFQNDEKEKRAAELIIANYARSLIEASLDPLVTISSEGKILDVNEASIKVTGVPREKLIDTDFSNYFTEPEKAQEGYQQVFEKGFVADYPLTIKHKDGNLTDVLYNASVYKDSNGKVLGVFAAARDVTAQKWAKDLRVANTELAYQNDEKEKRAAELGIANKELAFQNNEKQNRADELVVANKELAYQNDEKQKRADELNVANKELAFQNNEKQYRAEELIVANKELAFQNNEKQNRADELDIANKELAFQNNEKQKRADELLIANKELESFTYISSHDLQEPLRKIQTFSSRIRDTEIEKLSEQGKDYFQRIQSAASRMQTLINDLLSFTRISTSERIFETTNLNSIIDGIKIELKDTLNDKNASLEIISLCDFSVIPFQFRQLMYNLISNSLKFSKTNLPSHITIKSDFHSGYVINNEVFNLGKKFCHISIVDNGIGFEPHFSERIFEVFQKLHQKEDYAGTGIGLAIVKKIVENHNGVISAKSELGKGAQFNIFLPVL